MKKTSPFKFPTISFCIFKLFPNSSYSNGDYLFSFSWIPKKKKVKDIAENLTKITRITESMPRQY